ncbi:hypothetical protein K504DRAFT_450697 [Pleomassaria siparia CBS 279.74]|uniref:Uncharacterized protein n=1 Tax=Pleomassaria siparia CBS 279.74 TaxID=1314801 RepID=A0A6G1KMI6_9PLEO|nr:hypothetical protein K504DRAFT_450697 [Pleomassaria siparia CBS 279.74]
MTDPHSNRSSQPPATQHHILFQPPPQYPTAFQPLAGTQSTTLGSITSTTPPSSSRATTTSTSFHHYTPRTHGSSTSSTFSTSGHQPTRPGTHPITAPFQVPRMPMSWPWPTSIPNGQAGGQGQRWVMKESHDGRQDAGANPNIDPRLLGEGREIEYGRVGNGEERPAGSRGQ